MDDIDRAQQQVEKTLLAVLKKIDTRPVVQPTGFCLNCCEPLPHPERWCDGDCRDDWTKRKRNKP